jgi:hypothetical protein
VLEEFKQKLTEFLVANQGAIRAKRILVDFHVCSAPVPRRYVNVTEEVFRLHEQGDSIQEVVIFV